MSSFLLKNFNKHLLHLSDYIYNDFKDVLPQWTFSLAIISIKANFPELTFANSKFCQEDVISYQFLSNMKFYHVRF